MGKTQQLPTQLQAALLVGDYFVYDMKKELFVLFIFKLKLIHSDWLVG